MIRVGAVVAACVVGSVYAGDDLSSLMQEADVRALPPLEADRPDVTESPITVPKGMWQLEMTTAVWSRDESDGETTRSWSFGQVNMKYGFSLRDDIQVGFDTYTRERSGDDSAEGFGDVVIRWKRNLVGYRGESAFALGVLPFVKIPTGSDLSNDELEGGVVVPASLAVTEWVSLGIQIEPSYVFNDDSGEHEFGFGHTLALALDLGHDFGSYFEYIGFAAESDYEASFSGGLTYDVNANFRLDAGAVFGVNDAAQDISVFTGLTYRF